MKRDLPPLNAVKALDAIASHGGTRRAAHVLGVTPGALTKHIRNLETYLGIRLFEQRANGLKLTAAGLRYYREISKALSIVEQASRQGRAEPDDGALTIGVCSSLSLQWLTHVLDDFRAHYPGIDVRVICHPRAPADTSDVLVTRAARNDLSADRDGLIVDEQLVLVAHPALRGDPTLRTLTDAVTHPLFDRQAGADLLATPLHRGAHPVRAGRPFDWPQVDRLLQGVRSKRAVGMLPSYLCASALVRGDIVNPLNSSFRSRYAFAIETTREAEGRREVEWFIEFLATTLDAARARPRRSASVANGT